MSAMRAYGGSARSIVDGLVALGTIFIPGLAEVKDLPQAANMALKLIAKGGFGLERRSGASSSISATARKP